jgi:hypothetical protein
VSLIERILCFILRYREIWNNGKFYMRRFYLTPAVFGYQWRLHHILLSDPEPDPHDHPYDFWSWIISKTGYLEQVFTQHSGDTSLSKWNFRKRWSFVFRAAETIHRLKLYDDVWSIVLVGPTRRIWGYHTPTGFVPEREYHERA